MYSESNWILLSIFITLISSFSLSKGDGQGWGVDTKGPLGGWDDEESNPWQGPGWKLEDAIPGAPGQSYPNYDKIPNTSFDCKRQKDPGYYGDVETQCQVFHICQADGRQNSFLCPVGTIFNQETFVCDWWFNVNCGQSPAHYGRNGNLHRGPDIGLDGQKVTRHSKPQGNFKGGHQSQSHVGIPIQDGGQWAMKGDRSMPESSGNRRPQRANNKGSRRQSGSNFPGNQQRNAWMNSDGNQGQMRWQNDGNNQGEGFRGGNVPNNQVGWPNGGNSHGGGFKGGNIPNNQDGPSGLQNYSNNQGGGQRGGNVPNNQGGWQNGGNNQGGGSKGGNVPNNQGGWPIGGNNQGGQNSGNIPNNQRGIGNANPGWRNDNQGGKGQGGGVTNTGWGNRGPGQHPNANSKGQQGGQRGNMGKSNPMRGELGNKRTMGSGGHPNRRIKGAVTRSRSFMANSWSMGSENFKAGRGDAFPGVAEQPQVKRDPIPQGNLWPGGQNVKGQNQNIQSVNFDSARIQEDSFGSNESWGSDYEGTWNSNEKSSNEGHAAENDYDYAWGS